MDGRLQWFDTADSEPIGLGQARQGVQLFLVIERLIDRALELFARVAPTALRRILLAQADFIEHRGNETAPDFARRAQALDLHFQRAPQCAERGHPDRRRDHEAGKQPGQTEDDAPADGHHCVSGASFPACTTPMTTGFAGTSPRASKAIEPVTPSNAGRLPPVRATRSRTARRSAPVSVSTPASN